MMCYMYIWEHYEKGRHIDVAWSLIFEDLYSLEIDLGYLCDQCALQIIVDC